MLLVLSQILNYLHFPIQQKNIAEVDDIAYSVKEINTVAGKTVYNAIAVCSPLIMHKVMEAWGKAFGYSENMFVADKSCTKNNSEFAMLYLHIWFIVLNWA